MNIAVIGAGWWGKNIINTFEEIDSVKKVFVYDSNEEAYKKFVSNRKVDFVSDIHDIIDNISISSVCISTPPHTHYELSKLFLMNGKNERKVTFRCATTPVAKCPARPMILQW